LKAEDISIDYRLFGSKIQYYKLKADSLCKIVAWNKKFGYFILRAGEFVNCISDVIRTTRLLQNGD